MKFFKEDKWAKWWDSLPKHTQEYLSNQPIWHDRDVARIASVALAVGFIIGFFTGYR
jgi:hypothetical protein